MVSVRSFLTHFLRHLILEIVVIDGGTEQRHALRKVGLAYRGAKRIIMAALCAGRRQPGHELLPKTIQIGRAAGTDGQVLLAGFPDDAEKAEGGEKPHLFTWKLATRGQRWKRIRVQNRNFVLLAIGASLQVRSILR